MMKTKKTNIRPVITAAIITGLLIFFSGAGFHSLAARLESPVDTSVMTPEELNKLPLQIGSWSGKDVPLDEAIVRATDTDAHVNRQYFRQNALDTVGLYIAYGARGRDLMPHRPEVCYTGSGWTLVDKQAVELTLKDGAKLPCRILQFSQGTLDLKKVIVLDYYIVDGQYSSDVSLLRSKAWLGSGTIKYVAQIQNIASIVSNQDKESQIKNVTEFATESAPGILELFEHNQDNNLTNENIEEEGEGNGL